MSKDNDSIEPHPGPPTRRVCRCPFFCVSLIILGVTLIALGIWIGVSQVKLPSTLKGQGGYSNEDLLLCNLKAGIGTHYMLKVYKTSPEYTVKHFSLSYLSKYGLRNLHKALHESRKAPETVIYKYLTDLTAL